MFDLKQVREYYRTGAGRHMPDVTAYVFHAVNDDVSSRITSGGVSLVNLFISIGARDD